MVSLLLVPLTDTFQPMSYKINALHVFMYNGCQLTQVNTSVGLSKKTT